MYKIVHAIYKSFPYILVLHSLTFIDRKKEGTPPNVYEKC